jgi:hypothetical protein
MVNGTCKAYANGIVVVAESFDMFGVGSIATEGRIIASGNFSFTKRTLAGWISGS